MVTVDVISVDIPNVKEENTDNVEQISNVTDDNAEQISNVTNNEVKTEVTI